MKFFKTPHCFVVFKTKTLELLLVNAHTQQPSFVYPPSLFPPRPVSSLTGGMRQAGSPYFFTFHRRQGHYGTERRMAPWPASKLLPPMSTVGAGVKPSALGGRASRQVGGGDAMPAAAAGIWRAGQVGMCRHQGYERGNMTGSRPKSPHFEPGTSSLSLPQPGSQPPPLCPPHR